MLVLVLVFWNQILGPIAAWKPNLAPETTLPTVKTVASAVTTVGPVDLLVTCECSGASGPPANPVSTESDVHTDNLLWYDAQA